MGLRIFSGFALLHTGVCFVFFLGWSFLGYGTGLQLNDHTIKTDERRSSDDTGTI
jgi:hypothetical protein